MAGVSAQTHNLECFFFNPGDSSKEEQDRENSAGGWELQEGVRL